MKPKHALIVIGVAGVAVLATIAYLASRPADQPKPQSFTLSEPLESASDPSVGSSTAKVTIVEFGDLLCSACKASVQTVQDIMKQNPDKVRFVWKDFPLDDNHPNATTAAVAARCAGAQQKYWEYQDQVFQNQDNILASTDPQIFVNLATAIGLKTDTFSTCLMGGQFDETIKYTQAEGTALAMTKQVGGVGAIHHGGTACAIVNLPTGEYVIVCLIPSPADHVAHHAKGMITVQS